MLPFLPLPSPSFAFLLIPSHSFPFFAFADTPFLSVALSFLCSFSLNSSRYACERRLSGSAADLASLKEFAGQHGEYAFAEAASDEHTYTFVRDDAVAEQAKAKAKGGAKRKTAGGAAGGAAGKASRARKT